MGMRRNIALRYSEESKLYFYTHWGAEGLREELKKALIRGEGRWDDPAYLARIIFCEMVRDDVEGSTGFGIAPWETDPEYPTIAVDLEAQTVDGLTFAAFVQGDYENIV
jgi:hypothetical protein